jgi:pyruvate/2-oxoglutarate/acetoin dehydrogenase E1 component/pyruvate/2-oxoglutarate dehydrogenase complex dihydrolipoamide acyltransferase (E2) component
MLVMMNVAAPRIAESLNRALRDLLNRDKSLYLLGEDVLDPYGGAFKITKGLSSEFPSRVLTTPISESGILGVAGGLALCGNSVIVEMMFGDFLALGFDQVLNFASKSVSMYGRTVPMRLVVRCPVGGNRGYGPTHSQSLQKHFIGIPNLALYELSPFHEAEAVLATALEAGIPGIVFEDKVLYTRRMFLQERKDSGLRCEIVGPGLGWAHLSPDDGGGGIDLVIVAPGGIAHRAIEAASRLREGYAMSVHVITPAQLYPLDLDPVLPLLVSADRVAVVEESTAGGTWGSEVARLVYGRIWSSLRAPLLLFNSADSIIPTAGHLEREVLLGVDRICAGILEAVGWEGRRDAPTSMARATDNVDPGTPITIPKLNNNDATYLVVDWLAEEGSWVAPGVEVVSLETSKAVEDISTPGGGYLRRVAEIGDEKEVGDVLGYLVPEKSTQHEPPSRSRSSARPSVSPQPEERPYAPVVHQLERAQRGIAQTVAQSHREIPTGFTVVQAEVDGLVDLLATMSDQVGGPLGLPEVIVKAVALAHQDFPLFFGSLVDDQTVVLAATPEVGVTVDVGEGLYVPVVRGAHERSIGEIADMLMDFRMKALNKDFSAYELTGGNIAISLNMDPGVIFAQPLVLWPQLCMVSVGSIEQQCYMFSNGAVGVRHVVHIGLAYDHRVINGREAVVFLTRIRESLQNHGWLKIGC